VSSVGGPTILSNEVRGVLPFEDGPPCLVTNPFKCGKYVVFSEGFRGDGVFVIGRAGRVVFVWSFSEFP
jgi:hypothetical protein